MTTVDGRGAGVGRWLLAGRGPLKRGTDRVEMLFRMFLMVALLGGDPIGSLIAVTVYQHEEAVASRQAQDRRPVRAVVLVQPPAAVSADAVVQARVGWTDPRGAQQTADVAVLGEDPPPRQGHALDDARRAAGPPAPGSPGRDRDRRVGGHLRRPADRRLLLAQLALVRLGLNRRRARQWETEWLAIEPLWTARGR